MKGLLSILDKYTATLACVIVALLMFHSEYNKITIKNESDLTRVSGTLKKYSFLDNLPRNGKQYIIELVEYQNNFQIFADHINLFAKFEFQEGVHVGDSILLKVPVKEISYLNSKNERIMIAGLLAKKREFLVSRQVIMKEQGSAGLIAGVAFLIAGFVSFVVKFKNLA
ncbi:hypothetical protein [Ulvibacterium marinum]|uniref:hypothetical protein n=1 Tax=Ulvibacterium marinum TaxID=2419782 RepID=UPI002494E816|nr:hypothetical protein [Ulvibacterium marinum]